jgi:Tfp pilus assembly protein PilP
MRPLRHSYAMRRIFYLGMIVLVLVPLAGCEEANMAIDGILGRRSPVLSAAQQVSSQSLVPAKRRSPGGETAPPVVQPSAPAEHKVTGKPAKTETAGYSTQQGKRRAPGQLSPATQQALPPQEKKGGELFQAERNPFKAPTEVLPSECPPSMPLCRFDRSQLKLVGVIQVSEGEFKGMVEDPDGRGYFVTPGMQIGGATVTQVTNKGITLHLHKTRQDVVMPLFRGAREAGEL